MKDLGERIKEYRTSMKMTQADFAKSAFKGNRHA